MMNKYKYQFLDLIITIYLFYVLLHIYILSFKNKYIFGVFNLIIHIFIIKYMLLF